MRLFIFLLLYISISLNSVCAEEPLNLKVDPEIINESEEQQNAATKKNDQLLPDVFKDKLEHKISIEGGMLINDKSNKSEIIDGAGMSLKVKTNE